MATKTEKIRREKRMMYRCPLHGRCRGCAASDRQYPKTCFDRDAYVTASVRSLLARIEGR